MSELIKNRPLAYGFIEDGNLHSLIKWPFMEEVSVFQPIVNKMVHQPEILDLAGASHVNTGAVAFVQFTADGNVIFVHIGDGQIPGNHTVNFFFQLQQIDLRTAVEIHTETMAHIIVTGQLHQLRI